MDIRELSFEALKEKVTQHSGLVYDFEFARRVAERMTLESEFFFGKFSEPFLNDFAIWIAHENSYRDLMGFYYEYIASPFIENEVGVNIPEFNVLRKYDWRRKARLYTYVMTCTYREVVSKYRKKKPGDLVVGGKAPFDVEVLLLKRFQCDNLNDFLRSENEDIGWEILCAFFYDEDKDEIPFELRKKRIKKAFEWLQEKDRKVLRLLVTGEKSGLEAFEVMKSYVKPKYRGDDVDEWSDKEKQDTMASWKYRALERLEKLYKDPNMII